jgi:hypothetical protein
VESELRRRFVGEYPGTPRALSYANHANMGIYDLAVDQYLTGSTTTPEIAAVKGMVWRIGTLVVE